MRKLSLILFVIILIVYRLASGGATPYDYFTRLSDSFLQGKIYLQENPPWLNELIPAGEGKFFVAYPPMPAIIAMPFRLIFGQKFHQEYLSIILGAGISLLVMKIAWQIKKDRKLVIWSGLLTGFGTIIWFLSSVGSSWYLGQITSAFFLMVAIFEAIKSKRPFVVGLFLGASYLSRIHTILAFPLFLYLLFDKKDWFKRYFYFGLGVLPFILFDFYYNFIRFGVIWDKGYYLIPGVLNERWFAKGLFDLSYIPDNIKVAFASLPKFSKTFPYVTPSWAGLSIWITTPAFIYALFANIKEKIVQFSWLSILMIAFIVFGHGTTGFAQFGYRFAVDFYPILIFLTIKGVARTGIKWHHWLLLFISILVNLWGVLWINKFGWVGF